MPRARRFPERETRSRALPFARLATAAALLAAFVAAVLLLEPASLALLTGAILALGAWEWARLVGLRGARAASYMVAVLGAYGLGVWWLHPLASFPAPLALLLAVAALFWCVLAPCWLVMGGAPQPASWLRVAGFLVLIPAGLAIAALSPAKLLILLGFVWLADSLAYLVGHAFGHRKLAPSISPGKTWEGAAGAASGCLIYAIICAMLDPGLNARVAGPVWAPYLGAAAVLCAVSVVGDLFESALKRQAGVKDSGSLLPGHGGVLDRIDSVTAALPVGALLLYSIGAT